MPYNKFLEEFTKEILINSIKINPARQQEKQEEKDANRFPEIQNLIDNPEIQAIECPGPDRFLIIQKSGKISPINISLSEGEIKEIISIFAAKYEEKITNPFKINLPGLIISGVLSTHAGSRFIIEKI